MASNDDVASLTQPFGAQPFDAQSYMTATAAMIGLPIAARYAEEVRKNLERAAAIAAPLLATPIAEEVESAAVFQP